MKEVSTIGLDIAKNVFQVHGVDRTGAVAIRRVLRRSQMLAWFAKLPPVWWGWRRAARPIIGPASGASWGMRCD